MRKRRAGSSPNVIIAASARRPSVSLDSGEGDVDQNFLAYYNRGAEAERLVRE
jgi:hypothetical protein